MLTPPAGVPYYGMLTWLFEEIGRWKKAEGYTDTIGTDLGVIGSASTVHTDPPALTAGAVAQNSVELLFNLYEHDGVWLESLRQGENAFTFLATETDSPYVDNRPVKVPGQSAGRVSPSPRRTAALLGIAQRTVGVKRPVNSKNPTHVKALETKVKTICDWIKFKRLAKNLTLGHVAAKMGIATSLVRAWESGCGQPDVRQREVLANFLGAIPIFSPSNC